MSACFIGVDSGTQSTKAILIDGVAGKILAQASVPYEILSGLPDGAKEQNPKTWVDAMESVIRSVVASSKVKPEQIKAISISAQQHGFVPLDEKGHVIRPAKLWCDTSTGPQAEMLIRKLGGLEAVIEMTGNGIPSGFTASKILWLKMKEPKNYQRLTHILLPHDYLNYHLTGKMVMEAGDASGTGLFNTRTRSWETRVTDAIGPEVLDKLPPIQLSEQIVGEILPEVAARLGLTPATMVCSGGGDNMMGAIGTGNTKIGMITASLGTSGTIYAYSSRPIIDPKGEIASFCDSTGAWLPLACTMNVTVGTELIKQAFAWDNDRLTKEIASVPPGADGLFLLPYFNGERVPDLPAARASFVGLSTTNFTQAHLARATMEGVTLGLNYGLNRLRDLGIRPKQIRITGGGSKNPLWRQMLADVFDAEVVCLQTSEGAALGAALQAKWSYGLQRGEKTKISQITDHFVKIDKTTLTKPNKASSKFYRALQTRFSELTTKIAPVFPVRT